MEQCVSYIFICNRGHLSKVLQFLTPLEPIYNKNFCFYVQNIYYKHCYKF